ncbi:LysR family transcriptional regulator [Ramlibacter monticola]
MAVRLDDIDYFLAVARHGQVRRAASALGLSQPALTKGLHRLEKELGFPLFIRGARGMTLTPVAEQFRQRTQILRASLGDAIKEAADLHLGALGLLRVGVSPLYAQRLFVPACVQLHEQRPAARVRVMINLNDALVSALRLGDLDLSISALPGVLAEDLETIPLIKDDLRLVVREDHPLLSRRRVRIQDLASAEWMLPGPDVAARRSVEARLAAAGLPPPRIAVEVSNTAVQLSSLLVHSDLVSIMSEGMLDGPSGGGIAPLPFAEARFTREIGVMLRKGHALPPLAKRFLEILRECSRGSPARKRSPSRHAA